MKLILFRSGHSFTESIDVRLEHVATTVSVEHACKSDGAHVEATEVLVHFVTNAHLAAIYDAIGRALGKDVPEPKDDIPVPFRVERKDDGLWLRVEGYNRRQAAIRLSDNHGPIVTAAIEEAMARQELY